MPSYRDHTEFLSWYMVLSSVALTTIKLLYYLLCISVCRRPIETVPIDFGSGTSISYSVGIRMEGFSRTSRNTFVGIGFRCDPSLEKASAALFSFLSM